MREVPRLTQGRRLILRLLERHGGALTKTRLIKWLFLLSTETRWGIRNSPYEFVPYKYGAFSFVAYRDVTKLGEIGLISTREPGIEARRTTSPELAPAGEAAVKEIVFKYGHLSTDQLLRYTYRQYPWYSLLAEREDLATQRPARPVAEPAIYTIGYSGTTIDGLLNRLLRCGIAGIVDVRRAPLSRRYGFHGNTLARWLAEVGLEYVGVPSLGIASKDRRDTNDQAARTELLCDYDQRVRKTQMSEVRGLSRKLSRRPLALLCLEADPSECHRGVLGDILAEVSGLEVRHL